MSLVPFFIPDSSPLLSYLPCVDCAPQQSWQSAYTPRPDGYDQTFHQTTTKGNTVSFNLTSNGFGVTHATVSPECPLEYSINGSEFRSTCSSMGGGLQELDWGRHEVVLRTGNVTIFQLFGITGNHMIPKGDSNVNKTIDNAGSGFTYSPEGAWGVMKDDGSITGDTTLLDDYLNHGSPNVTTRSNTYVDAGLNKRDLPANTSIAVTASAATMDLKFKGSAIYVYGLSGPSGGQARVKLDNREVAELNMTSVWETSGVLLYTTSGLDAGVQHHLLIENLIPGKHLVVDYAIITQTRNTKSTIGAPLIAGVVGGIVVIILLGIVLYYYLIARMKYKLRPPPSAHSSGTKTPHSKVDSWRKQTPPQSAEACSPMETYHTESIYGGIMAPLASKPSTGKKLGKRENSNSGNWPIAKLYTKRDSFKTLRSDSGGTNLSAPSFPDYIPYKSPSMWGETDEPVPAIPDSALLSSKLGTSNLSRTGHSPLFSAGGSGMGTRIITSRTNGPRSPATPPAIVGMDSTTERWIQENTYVGNRQGNPAKRSLSNTSHRSQPQSRSRSGSGHSETSLSRSDVGSPNPDTEFEIVGVTHRAQNARRSIARLWPSNTPSLYRINTDPNHSTDIPLHRSNSDITAVAIDTNQTVPVSASNTATAGLSSIVTSYPSYIRPSPPQSQYAFQTPHLATYTSSGVPPSPPTQGQGLRRGVSVKSVKSFLTHWTRPGDAPREIATPARPDSGIFPHSHTISSALGLGSVDVPLDTAPKSGGSSRGGANMFIELYPESPLTASRPPSEWPSRSKVWVSGGAGSRI